MIVFDMFAAFAQAVDQAHSFHQLHSLLARATRDLGCDYFALVHHVDRRRNMPGAVRLHNYPYRWVRYFDDNGLAGIDPIQRASERAGWGFGWRAVGDYVALSETDLQILALARQHGIGDGYTIPYHLPGEFLGSCSFAVKPGRSLQPANIALAHLVGRYAFNAARRLHGLSRLVAVPRTRLLTLREHEITRLVAAGKSNWEAGRILGISEYTARQYVSDSLGKLGVHHRAALTYRALRSGEISFAEVPL